MQEMKTHGFIAIFLLLMLILVNYMSGHVFNNMHTCTSICNTCSASAWQIYNKL